MVLPLLVPMAEEQGTKVVMVVVIISVPTLVLLIQKLVMSTFQEEKSTYVIVEVTPALVMVVVEMGEAVFEGPLPVPVPDPVPVTPGTLPEAPVEIGIVGNE